MPYKSIHDIVLDLKADAQRTDMSKTASAEKMEKAAEVSAFLRQLADAEDDVQKQAASSSLKDTLAAFADTEKTKTADPEADVLLQRIRDLVETKTVEPTKEPVQKTASVEEDSTKTQPSDKSLRELLVAAATAHKVEG